MDKPIVDGRSRVADGTSASAEPTPLDSMPAMPDSTSAVATPGVATPTEAACLLARSRDDRAARDIERGVMRLLRAHGMVGVAQMSLPDGRRADIAALAADGRIVIIEIKSCLADFRSDAKWEHYRAFADAIYFAVDAAFPIAVLPESAGLILADRFGGAFERAGLEQPLSAARRKAMIIRIARTAAARLHALADPDADSNVV